MGVTERFHIGRLGRESGRSVHTIRWYERQGLMPGVTRDAGGRRVYTSQHIGWLQFLERLRFAGMSIKEMRRYASLAMQGKRTLRQRLDLLRAQHEHTTALIDELREALRFIERKQAYYLDWLDNDRWPGEFVIEQPARSSSRSVRKAAREVRKSPPRTV